MNESEVKVGQVFRDGDSRVAQPYFTVTKVGPDYAVGTRSIDLDGNVGHAGKAPQRVQIALRRLIKTGTRGYNLVKAPAALLATSEAAAV